MMENTNLLSLVLRYKKHIALCVGIAVVLAVVFSSSIFIKPRYKSFAIVYPSNLTPYTKESETEQMMQLLESNDIKNEMIRKFNLSKHYKIDSTSSNFYTSLLKEYEENVSVKKTEYESVKIEVLDTDPQIACDMVNEILYLLNLKQRSLQRAKTAEVVKVLKNQMDVTKIEMDSMETVMKELRVKYGILDYEAQSKEVSKRYLKMVSEGKTNAAGMKEIDEVIKNLQEKGGEYVSLKEHLWRTRGRWNDLKTDYQQALRDVAKELTYSNTVTKPFPADRKSYPVRWLIVLVSAVSSFFFMIVILSVIDNKKLNQNQ